MGLYCVLILPTKQMEKILFILLLICLSAVTGQSLSNRTIHFAFDWYPPQWSISDILAQNNFVIVAFDSTVRNTEWNTTIYSLKTPESGDSGFSIIENITISNQCNSRLYAVSENTFVLTCSLMFGGEAQFYLFSLSSNGELKVVRQTTGPQNVAFGYAIQQGTSSMLWLTGSIQQSNKTDVGIFQLDGSRLALTSVKSNLLSSVSDTDVNLVGVSPVGDFILVESISSKASQLLAFSTSSWKQTRKRSPDVAVFLNAVASVIVTETAQKTIVQVANFASWKFGPDSVTLDGAASSPARYRFTTLGTSDLFLLAEYQNDPHAFLSQIRIASSGLQLVSSLVGDSYSPMAVDSNFLYTAASLGGGSTLQTIVAYSL